MKVLVTGASGLLGRAVAETIMQHGHRVTVMQRRPSGLDCDEVLGDITNELAVRTATSDQDAVVHLAAKVSPTGQWRDFEAVNVGGTKNLIEASHKAGIDRFIYVSSPAVASSGAAHVGEPALPADPTTTRSHYARSKATAEKFVLSQSGPAMLVAAIRPHLVWGPGDEQLVARIVDRASKGAMRLIGSGAALVDSTYVDNAADAIAASLKQVEAIHGRALVVSNGEPRPVADLVGGLCRAAGLTLPPRRVPATFAKAGGAVAEVVWATARMSQDPPMTRFLAEQLSTAHWYDQRETQTLLNWTPTVSLDQGLARLTSWFAEQRAEAMKPAGHTEETGAARPRH